MKTILTNIADMRTLSMTERKNTGNFFTIPDGKLLGILYLKFEVLYAKYAGARNICKYTIQNIMKIAKHGNILVKKLLLFAEIVIRKFMVLKKILLSNNKQTKQHG